jgi:hypothetical protein
MSGRKGKGTWLQMGKVFNLLSHTPTLTADDRCDMSSCAAWVHHRFTNT